MNSALIPILALGGGVIVGLVVGSIIPRLRAMRRRPLWQQMLVSVVASLVIFEALYWPVIALLKR